MQALPVLKSAAACALWLAAAAVGADAGRTGPVAAGRRSGSKRDDAADEEGDLCLRTPAATSLTAP